MHSYSIVKKTNRRIEFDKNRDLAPLKGVRYILNLNTNETIYFVLKLLFSEAKKSNIYKHLLLFIIASIFFIVHYWTVMKIWNSEINKTMTQFMFHNYMYHYLMYKYVRFLSFTVYLTVFMP